MEKKKLQLKKETIASLSKKSMSVVRGGDNGILTLFGVSCKTPCPTEIDYKTCYTCPAPSQNPPASCVLSVCICG
jgi:natural product precursor